jgi:hypothetical protein
VERQHFERVVGERQRLRRAVREPNDAFSVRRVDRHRLSHRHRRRRRVRRVLPLVDFDARHGHVDAVDGGVLEQRARVSGGAAPDVEDTH